jgi:hypothetical protein
MMMLRSRRVLDGACFKSDLLINEGRRVSQFDYVPIDTSGSRRGMWCTEYQVEVGKGGQAQSEKGNLDLHAGTKKGGIGYKSEEAFLEEEVKNGGVQQTSCLR